MATMRGPLRASCGPPLTPTDLATVDTFNIPTGAAQSSLEIKRSQFIACTDHTKGVEAALAFIESVRQRYPDANHHCYAYVAGAPDDIYHVDKSDDGEPRGTAGKPMLNVLQHSNLGEITVVVVRYFGGVKLGAGGLVRAYTQSVSSHLKTLDTREFVFKELLHATLSYSVLDRVEHWLAATSVDIVEKRFDAEVHLTLAVPRAQVGATVAALQEIGQGSISCRFEDAND